MAPALPQGCLRVINPSKPRDYTPRRPKIPHLGGKLPRLELDIDRMKQQRVPRPEYEPPKTIRLENSVRRQDLRLAYTDLKATTARPMTSSSEVSTARTAPPVSSRRDRYRTLKDQAKASFLEQDFSAAVEHVTEAIEMRPTYDLLCFRSRIYQLLDDFPLALIDADAAVEIDPVSPLGHICRGNALLAVGEFNSAGAAYESALTFIPADSVAALGHELAIFNIQFDRLFYLNRDDLRLTSGRYFEKKIKNLPEVTHKTVQAKSSEPSPLRKKDVDSQWKSLDVGDLTKDQDKLRNTFDSVLASGKMDRQAAMRVQRIIKASGVPKSVSEKITNMAQNQSLSEEDRDLILSLRPPQEAQAEWPTIVAMMQQYSANLIVLFRHYALTGRTTGKLDIMTLSQFQFFAKDCRLLEPGTNVTKSLVERVFIRANWEPPVAGSKSGGSTKELELHEFVNAILRLSFWRFPLIPGLAGRFKKLIEEHLLTNSVLRGEDALIEAIGSREVKEMVSEHRDFVSRLFLRYATMNQRGVTRKQRKVEDQSIDVMEYEAMLKELDLYNDDFTTREARTIFVNVNVDDDIYEQADANNNSSVLVLDEFEEVMVRISVEYAGVEKSTVQGLQLARIFDEFVESVLKKKFVQLTSRKVAKYS